MLRLALSRSVHVARATALPRPALISSRTALQHVRFESSKVSDERKKVLEAQNDLQRDWDAKVITYEELKPKTVQPSPVSFHSHRRSYIFLTYRRTNT